MLQSTKQCLLTTLQRHRFSQHFSTFRISKSKPDHRREKIIQLCEEDTVSSINEAHKFLMKTIPENPKRRHALPGRDLCNLVACKLAIKRKAGQVYTLYKAMVKTKMFPDIILCSAVMQSLIENRMMPEAYGVYLDLENYGYLANADTLEAILKWACTKTRINNPGKLYKDMVDLGKHPDVFLCNMIMRDHCEDGNFKEAFGFLGLILKTGQVPSNDTFAILMSCLCKQKCLDLAEEMLELMPAEGCYPECLPYNVLIEGMCSEGKCGEALNVFDKMIGRDVSPDVVTYNALIGGLCKARELWDAKALRNAMRGRGIEADTVTYSLLIDGLCKNGNASEGLIIFQEMLKRNIGLDVVSYSCLIDGLCNQGMIDEARGFLYEMLALQLCPSDATYNCVVDGFSKQGRWEEAVGVLNYMNSMGYMPALVTYISLIDRLCGHGEVVLARSLLFTTIHYGHQPDPAMFNTVMMTFCKLSRMDEVVELYWKMLKIYCVPDAETYSTLMLGFHEMGNRRGVERVISWMDKDGFKIDDSMQEMITKYLMEPNSDNHVQE